MRRYTNELAFPAYHLQVYHRLDLKNPLAQPVLERVRVPTGAAPQYVPLTISRTLTAQGDAVLADILVSCNALGDGKRPLQFHIVGGVYVNWLSSLTGPNGFQFEFDTAAECPLDLSALASAAKLLGVRAS